MGLHSANKVWKKDETAALITLYETERCLYDRKHKDFNDSAKQKEAYERIHEVMSRIRPSCSVTDIKYKINSLQRQYSGELLHRNISIKAGMCTEFSYKSAMWCFGLLQFLDAFLELKDATKTVVSADEDNEEPVIEDNNKKLTSAPKINNLNKDAAGTSDLVIKNGVHENHIDERTILKRRKLGSPSSSRSITKVNVPEDSFDREEIFGHYVASEMKTLKDNPLLYLQTKQSILEILTSANFELINPE